MTVSRIAAGTDTDVLGLLGPDVSRSFLQGPSFPSQIYPLGRTAGPVLKKQGGNSLRVVSGQRARPDVRFLEEYICVCGGGVFFLWSTPV